MFCENCGNQIMDTQKFCGVCGTKNKTYKEVNVEDRMQETVKEDKHVAKTDTKKNAKKSVVMKVIAGIAGISVACGGFAVAYHHLPERTDEQKQEQVTSEKEEVAFVLSNEEWDTIQLVCGWYDELQKQADGYIVRNDYVLELSNNNISAELLNFVASNIVCNDDTLGVEVGIGEFLETQKSLTLEECKTILKDTFEYEVDSEEDMSQIFKQFNENSFFAGSESGS